MSEHIRISKENIAKLRRLVERISGTLDAEKKSEEKNTRENEAEISDNDEDDDSDGGEEGEVDGTKILREISLNLEKLRKIQEQTKIVAENVPQIYGKIHEAFTIIQEEEQDINKIKRMQEVV